MLHETAIEHLKDGIAAAKVIVARKYGKPEWLVPALIGLCLRRHTLTVDEARLLDTTDVVLISKLRQEAWGRATKTNMHKHERSSLVSFIEGKFIRA
jgi:hypothetical protein